MSLIALARAKSGGGGGGGSAEFESGSITLASSKYEVTITHNLNTDYLFGVIYKKPINGEVICTARNEVIYFPFIVRIFQNDLYSGTLLRTDYTSSDTKTKPYTDEANSKFVRYKSSDSTAAAAWNGLSMPEYVDTVTPNSFKIHTQFPYEVFVGGSTYYWKIWKLGEI